MMQMNLEPIIQSEVSQKEKNKYILTNIHGIQKDGTDEIICWAAMEMQSYGHGGRGWEEKDREGGIYGESNMETYFTMWKTDSQQEFAV